MSDFCGGTGCKNLSGKLNQWLTHATVLTEDFDEIKGVETQQQDELVLTFSVVAGSLSKRDGGERHGCICAQFISLRPRWTVQ